MTDILAYCEDVGETNVIVYIKSMLDTDLLNDTHVCALISMQGDWRLLEFAHSQGYVWNENTCSESAKYGHLGCLKYAHEKG